MTRQELAMPQEQPDIFQIVDLNAVDITDKSILIRRLDVEMLDDTLTQSAEARSLSLGVQIAVPAVIVAAATALANAFVKRLGENLADQLTASLTGNGDDAAFRTEVISRLDRIEYKIDSIIRFLGQIPELIRREIEYGLIADRTLLLRGQAAAISAELPTFLARRDDAAALALKIKADAALQTGYEILLKGKEWYMAAVHAMGAALPCYARLIKRDARFAGSLAEWSRLYREIMTPWIDAGISDSYPAVYAHYLRQKAEADEAMRYPPNVHFLICINGPYRYEREKNQWTNLWHGQSALLRQRTAEGEWFDGGVDQSGRGMLRENPPQPNEFGHGHPRGLAVLPWWPVEVTMEDRGAVFYRMLARANELGRRQVQWQAKIDELDIAKTTIDNLLRSCSSLEQLKV